MGEEEKGQGVQEDRKGPSKGQPRTVIAKGPASFAISCHFSIEDIFTDEESYKPINWFLNLSGFHP